MGARGPGAKPVKRQSAAVEATSSEPKPWHKPGLSRAGKVIAFIEHLTIASGKGAGEKFHLRPWQREIIEGIYATDQDGIRLVSEALMTVARKNGKTELAAALCLCHLAGPEAEPAGECYSAAADRHMAGRIFHELERFILKDNELSERCHIRRFTKEIEVAHGEGEGSVYQALSSDATKAHSLNPSFVVCDEVAQWRGRELFDNLRTGFGARAEPLLVAISTKSQDPHSVMSELVDYGRKVLAGVIQDPAFYAVIYETPIPEDPEAYAAQMTDEECWKLSNPALGDFRSLTEIRKVAAQALRIPAREAAFRSLYLNQEIDAEERAIPMAEWQACRGEIDVEALRGQRCYGGLDLSSTTDLTSLALYFPDSGALLSWSWAPKENIATREELDRVPYRQWVDQGLLRTTEGKAVNRREIARQLASIVAPFDLQLVGYDTWRIEDLLSILADEGIELPLVPFVQAASMMAPAYDAFETAVLDRALAHDGGQLLTWAVSNLALSTDSNGNRKPDKGKARERIDPAVAAIMAVGLAAREKPEDDTDRPFKGLTGGLISGRVQPLQRKGERRADAA